MSRLIDAVKLMQDFTIRQGEIPYNVFYGVIKDTVDKQATAEKENGWIPCSERLPNKGEMILFQCKNGDMFVGKYKGLDSYNKEIWSTYGAKGRVMNGRKGIAWISLPEPFKEADFK